MIYKKPTIVRSNVRFITGLVVILSAITAWAIRHIYVIVSGNHGNLEIIFALAFLVLAWTTLLSLFDIPKKVNRYQQSLLNKLNIAVIIPMFNEDPDMLKLCLTSIFTQTRKPNQIFLIDDGSYAANYAEIKSWATTTAKKMGIKFVWRKTQNMGKRHAQSVAVKLAKRTDIFVTIDSDGILDKQAFKEGLKPFIDIKVNSVAGVVVTLNSQKNLLTRLSDLWFLTGQLIDRSSMSVMGGVLVNSGVLAFYRANILNDNLEAYLNEEFYGANVEFSDDSMLTMYALASGGKAVQQTSSFAFTLMPENVSHHLRQYLRWMRGAFIRTWWRFKYLPLNSYAYWAHFFGWMQMVLSTLIFIALFVIQPAYTREVIPYLILVPILVGYGQALRYFTVKRSDEGLLSQMLTFLLAPLATLWTFFVLRIVRWYAMATCKQMNWGTRKNIEVSTSN